MAQQARPPVVTILGHVDHGKTSLLDYIRKAHVAAGEAGGITQHIGAYQAEFQNKKITFIDTPGHAAFSKMRSRGAQVTDIAVLVVAADDGVMPQTIESIKYIHAANVPMIVAINKIDLQGVNTATIKAQLTEHEVFVTGYGGDVEVVELSAKTGQGVDTLLETILMMGEILELQADPEGEFRAAVIESSRDKHKGSLATILVQNGTLRKKDEIYAGTTMSVVRTLSDALGKNLDSAGPSVAVEVTGFTEVPPVGTTITAQPVAVVEKESTSIPSFALQFGTEESQEVRLIVKADYAGSLEAVLGSLPTENVNVVATGIGDVSESDIQMAETSHALIVTFQTKASGAMQKQADRLGVKIKSYRIIYDMLDELEKEIYYRLNPAEAEKETAQSKVLKVFHMRGEVILGCKVLSGVLRLGDLVHVQRDGKTVYSATVKSLKNQKSDIPSAEVDEECGLVLQTREKGEPAEGDIVLSYKIISG